MTVSFLSIPKYCRHKASGQAYVWSGQKRHYLGEYNSPVSRERYAAFIAELTISPSREATITVDRHITIIELCAAYLTFARNYYVKNGKPSGWLQHIRLMLQKALDLYGYTAAEEFGPLNLKAIRQTMIDAGHSRQYINKMVPIITRMFKWAAAEELISSNVYHSLQTVDGLRQGRTAAHESPPVLPVDDTVVQATLPYVSVIVADMVRFQRLTGARPGEVCQLRPVDLDRSGAVWTYRPASHKTEHYQKTRTIYIGPKAQAVLTPYLDRPADSYCFSPIDSEEKRHEEMRAKRKTLVQPSQVNRKKSSRMRQPRASYTKDSYRRAIKRAIDKGNKTIKKQAKEMGVEPVLIPHWHPNQLRHTAATVIRKQYGLEAAQIILGHAKADVTQIYAERDLEKANEVMRILG